MWIGCGAIFTSTGFISGIFSGSGILIFGGSIFNLGGGGSLGGGGGGLTTGGGSFTGSMKAMSLFLFTLTTVLTALPTDAESLSEEDVAFVREAYEVLPDGEFTPETWGLWINAIKDRTGRKGKPLFMPMRIALTGRMHGPEMANMLVLMGRDEVVRRQV